MQAAPQSRNAFRTMEQINDPEQSEVLSNAINNSSDHV